MIKKILESHAFHVANENFVETFIGSLPCSSIAVGIILLLAQLHGAYSHVPFSAKSQFEIRIFIFSKGLRNDIDGFLLQLILFVTRSF